MSPAAWRLALAWVAGFTLIDSSIVSLALAAIAADFDRSIAEVAWVATGFLVALAATLIAAGRLRDRFGDRRVMTAGALAFLVTTAASGLAPTFELLVAARIAQGAAGGVLYTVSLAIATTAFPPERRATAISIYFTSGAFGAVIGPAAGGFLTDLGGWRAVFLAQLPVPALLTVMALVLLPRTDPQPSRFDLVGVALASLFVLALTYGLLQVPEPGSGPTVAAAGVAAVGALAGFIVRERRTDAPAVRLSIFRNRRFVAASIAGAAAWFTILSATVYPAVYLQLARGLDAGAAGILLLSAPAVGLGLFPFMGRIVAMLGVDRAVTAGLAILLASAAMMATWESATETWFIVLTLLATGLGLAVTLVASATDALSQFPPAEAGTGSALFNSLRQLGAALGVALPAVAFELAASGSRAPEAALAGSSAAFLLRVAVLAIPLAVVLLLRSRRLVAARAESPA